MLYLYQFPKSLSKVPILGHNVHLSIFNFNFTSRPEENSRKRKKPSEIWLQSQRSNIVNSFGQSTNFSGTRRRRQAGPDDFNSQYPGLVTQRTRKTGSRLGSNFFTIRLFFGRDLFSNDTIPPSFLLLEAADIDRVWRQNALPCLPDLHNKIVSEIHSNLKIARCTFYDRDNQFFQIGAAWRWGVDYMEARKIELNLLY